VTSRPRRGDVLLDSTDYRETVAEIRLETP